MLLSKVFRGPSADLLYYLSTTVSLVVLYWTYSSKLGLLLPQLRKIAELYLTSSPLCSLEALSKQGAIRRGLILFPSVRDYSPILANV